MVQKNYRAMFLEEFTRELIMSSRKERPFFLPFHPVKQELEIPKIIQKEMQPSIEIPKSFEMPRRMQQSFNPAEPKPLKSELRVAPQTPRIQMPPVPEIVSPSPQPLPMGFSLGKIDSLISDNRIVSIECSGPGKLISVRSMGKVIATQITLTDDEIKKVIGTFSLAAKIPIISGIFKAAIGNLVITAVISDFVGSRFIINKYTPYSILEQAPVSQNQQFPIR